MVFAVTPPSSVGPCGADAHCLCHAQDVEQSRRLNRRAQLIGGRGSGVGMAKARCEHAICGLGRLGVDFDWKVWAPLVIEWLGNGSFRLRMQKHNEDET
jgi:hypothetical protein